ncbi:methyltransferase domain-containing protein [Thermodesulfobacteriota bacterium]
MRKKIILTPRPSKISFIRLFEKLIKESEPFDTILDCASAGAKNIRFFQRKRYFGIDINKAIVEASNNMHNSDPNIQLYHDDVLDFQSKVKELNFDLVVSTHTIGWIKNEKKMLAIKNLIDRVKIGGDFIFQCTNAEQQYLGEISKYFNSTVIYPYRGLGSQLYEKLLQWFFGTNNVGGLGSKVRFPLDKQILLFVNLMSNVLAMGDRFIHPDHYLIHYRGKVDIAC